MKRFALLLTMSLAGTSSAESPAVIDGNGGLIGSYLGPAGVLPATYGPPLTSTEERSLRVVSTKGFIFSVQQASGRITSSLEIPGGLGGGEGHVLVYTTTNCTGQAYVSVGADAAASSARGGFVVANPSGLWFANKTAVAESVLTRSVFIEGNTPSPCETNDQVKTVIPVQPNNSNITGVTGPVFVTPITISQVVVPRPLFTDGFEQIPS